MDKLNKMQKNVGSHIREKVIPQGMSVKDAANLLGVGRPALSNLLNGHAALSPDMAARIERAFGTSARELMDMQAAFDTKSAQEKGVAFTAKTYIPPFMQFKAHDIEQWASPIKARTRLAVFLRILINSTGLKINMVDFPGNDDAERPGWDGFLVTEEGTPWIPAGRSWWEFGTNNDPRQKADNDYQKSVGQVSPEERSEFTFVFVTPRRWIGKNEWREKRLAEHNWKDVRVYDASDLEQWLEQSIPGQAWLANEMSVPAQGVISLDECWRKWVADSEPTLSKALFEEAVRNTKNSGNVLMKLTKSEPVIISSHSTEEALAFLDCLFSPDDPEFSQFRDRVAVFTQPGTLSRLAAKPSDFIAVITNRDVEREFAPYKKDLRSIIIYPRNLTNTAVDVSLEPLSYESFWTALETMGCNRDKIDMLGRESGRSLTVLRRRLSTLEAIRTPEWATDSKTTAILSGIVFAGAWDSRNESDKAVLSLLANDIDYDQLENQFADLLLLSDSPVWSIGHMRGLVSKIDTLYAINKKLVWADIERFLDLAEQVLSEDDPSLDLPEEQQWAASIYGKTREISSTLRKEIGESLVILAVHGNFLFRDRLGHDIETKIGQIIKSLLTPLTTRRLEAQSNDLPLYAEAAPEVFLQIFEEDLNSNEPQSLGLMRPVQSAFGRNPRAGLLWALESIAWSPEFLIRTVRILAELAQPVINDNWVNKPIESLSSIFRSWMPQTTAPLKARVSALEYLAKHHPNIAWTLCVEQFDGYQKLGTHSYKPLWRTGAHGAGNPVEEEEQQEFLLKTLEMALDWRTHTAETLGDLVSCIEYLPKEFVNRIWKIIEDWSSTATDSERSVLREKIRTSVFMRRTKRNKKSDPDSRAYRIYLHLEPDDTVLRYEWLFKSQWVEESFNELEDEELDFTTRSLKIEALRRDALTEVMAERGLDGVLDLAARGECAVLIGWLLTTILVEKDEIKRLIESILELGPLEDSEVRRSVIVGVLHGLVSGGRTELIIQLINGRELSEILPLLLQAPFTRSIWDIVETLDATAQRSYWKAVNPRILRGEEINHKQYAIDHLIAVNRPIAAFTYVQYDLAGITAKSLFRLVSAIAKSNEAPGSYKLDRYHLSKAFKLLTESGEIPVDQMAGLEFQFIEFLTGEESRIPNLEKQIEAHPELFVQAVAMAYKRADGGEDPKELSVPNQKSAVAAYHLLEKLSIIPGHDNQGNLNYEEIVKWVRRVRELAEELSRKDVCDVCLGKLFSNAPVGEDGIWPCETVREAIEQIATDKFSKGVSMGLYNAGGAQWRSEGGDEERQLADKYESWALSLAYNYPRVSAIHKQMAKYYRWDAVWENNEAEVRRRLLD